MAKKSARRPGPVASAAGRPPRARNELRIIGGKWRGRRIRFAPVPDLRPSPDRVRETLFNWLRDAVPGSRCLDLFAGSGALGIEALSRGAVHVTFVERDPEAVRHLRDSLTTLGAGAQGAVQRDDALRFLQGPAASYHVVFLDPPFASDLIAEACALLEARGWLAPDATIYIERPAREPLPALPGGWQVVRSKRAGEVGYHLARRETGVARRDAP
jgi:16S rRNA (guanine966-N2)-methyltransferase